MRLPEIATDLEGQQDLYAALGRVPKFLSSPRLPPARIQRA